MPEIIDLALVLDANRLLERQIERRGINWFIRHDGNRLMALDPSRVEMIVSSARRLRERAGAIVSPEAVEHCRKKLRRSLIRELAVAMVASGC